MRTHAAEEKIVTYNYNKMYGVRHRYNVPVLFTSPSALGDIHAGSIVTLDRWSFYLNFACEAQISSQEPVTLF